MNAEVLQILTSDEALEGKGGALGQKFLPPVMAGKPCPCRPHPMLKQISSRRFFGSPPQELLWVSLISVCQGEG